MPRDGDQATDYLGIIAEELRNLRLLREFELGVTIDNDPDHPNTLQLIVGRANNERGKGVVIWDEYDGDLVNP